MKLQENNMVCFGKDSPQNRKYKKQMGLQAPPSPTKK